VDGRRTLARRLTVRRIVRGRRRRTRVGGRSGRSAPRPVRQPTN